MEIRARHGLLFGVAIAAVACAVTAPAVHAPTSAKVARGRHAAIAAGEPRAAKVGLDTMRRGGNAIDAAVATALALAVTHPQAGNLGGGGFMVIRMADGRTAAIDFRERAPERADRDMYLRGDGSADPDLSRIGALAGGVPGSPAGLAHALGRFGTMRLEDVAGPAIALARDGFVVGEPLASDLRDAAPLLGRFGSTRAVFFRDGAPIAAGERLVQRDLAGTLERFARDGFRGFYAGETAARIAAHMRRDGGLITETDLAAYEVVERDVLRGSYRGYEVLAMPPASSGGIALLEILNILEPYDLAGAGFGSARATHLLIEAMRRAFADRARWLGDSDHWPVPIEGLISKAYAGELRRSLRLDRATDVAPGRPPGAEEGDDTTHFSVVDGAGNAVSCTTTINSTFGSGLVLEGTGVLLNNEMDDFSAKPGVPNQFGLVGYEANAIRPEKRPLSSMTPTILVEDGEVRFVLGSPGGGRIINTVAQVVLDVVDHRMPLEDAIAAPRVHHQWKPNEVSWEPDALSPETRASLEAFGHTFAPNPRRIGRCQAIEVLRDGTRIGVSDPRSGGAAFAY